MVSISKSRTRYGIIALVVAGVAILYGLFDPATAGFFPQCPFRVLTGLDCPGCGSQRAIHHLLHLDIAGAFRQNALLVLAIPYLVFGFVISKTPSSAKSLWRLHTILYGRWAIFTIIGIIIIFWIFRNI